MEAVEQKESNVVARREIDRDEATPANVSRSASTSAESEDGTDSPRSNDLDRWFTAATQGAEESWAELIKVESMNARLAIVSIGLLLLMTLIGFALVCWGGFGWLYESILMAR